jgi:serine protease
MRIPLRLNVRSSLCDESWVWRPPCDEMRITRQEVRVSRVGWATLIAGALALALALSAAVASASDPPDSLPRYDQLLIRLVAADGDPNGGTPIAAAKRANVPLQDLSRSLAANATPVELTLRRATHAGSWVVRTRTNHFTTPELMAMLRADPRIAHVEWDRFLYPQLLPNDPLFGQQWEMMGALASVRAPETWDLTTGDPAIVIAIADTGIRPHQQFGNRLLPGYDFVSLDPDGEPFRANDGNGRDADASDPGDWVTNADLARLQRFPEIGDDTGCRTSASSWHGTKVAGIASAAGNDGERVAGLNWRSRVLPIRVLGKCGERTSDVADGIAWAAGLSVPGIPDNPHPAHVINVSLGATGTCSELMRETIRRALAGPTLRAVVIAAGNSARDYRDFTPANCPGAISVAALGRNGELASYSNYGALTIAAPGGANSGSMLVIGNTGTTTPGSDSTSSGSGTSFAAPMVAGVISLMLSVNKDLSADQVRSILTQTARPFVHASCDYARCGAGMLDALDAVRVAQATRGEGVSRPYADRPRHDATDLWVAEGESGWGLNVTQRPTGAWFAVVYTYDRNGRPQWLTLPDGNWLADGVRVGRLYRTTGPAPASSSATRWDSAIVQTTSAGTFRLVQTNPDEVELLTQMGEGTRRVKMRRLGF